MIKKIGKVYTSKENYDVINSCIEINEPVLLIGETGTGKTTLLNELAKKNNKNLIRVSLNGSTGIEEIKGKWLVEKSSTKWQDGILTMAMKNGDWIVFDEINSALPEVLFTLHSLLDDDKKILLEEKENEVIKPHQEFRFFASMNPSEEYAGTKDMNRALISRFNAVVEFNVLSPKDEVKAIINQTKINSQDAVELVEIANEIRKLKYNSEIFHFVSTRDLIQAGRLISGGLSKDLAIKFAIINKMSKDEKVFTSSIVSRIKKLVLDNEVRIKSIFEDLEKIEKYDKEISELKERESNYIRSIAELDTKYTALLNNHKKLSETIAQKIIELSQE